MRSYVLAAVFLPLTAPMGWAACAPGQDARFHCSVKGGAKLVEVCHGGGVTQYSFGAAGKPAELALNDPIETLDYTPWNGIGRSIYEEVAFANGDYLYTVYAAYDRLVEGDDADRLSGGVVVTKADQTLAQLECDAGSISHQLDAYYDDKLNAGQCWNFETFSWSSDCPSN